MNIFYLLSWLIVNFDSPSLKLKEFFYAAFFSYIVFILVFFLTRFS